MNKIINFVFYLVLDSEAIHSETNENTINEILNESGTVKKNLMKKNCLYLNLFYYL